METWSKFGNPWPAIAYMKLIFLALAAIAPTGLASSSVDTRSSLIEPQTSFNEHDVSIKHTQIVHAFPILTWVLQLA